jgi:peroxiredoxin
LQEVVGDIEAQGATLVAISPQVAKFSKQVAKKHELTFSILGDPHNRLAAQFGLVFQLSDDLRKLYQSFGIDYERFYGDDSWSLPMPARFIVDEESTIIHDDVNPDYTQRPEPTEIAKFLASRQRG